MTLLSDAADIMAVYASMDWTCKNDGEGECADGCWCNGDVSYDAVGRALGVSRRAVKLAEAAFVSWVDNGDPNMHDGEVESRLRCGELPKGWT